MDYPDNTLCILSPFLLAYIVGAFPTGYLMGRASGVDIRKAGSGNIGATNVLRVLGTRKGIFVLLVDALKGVLGCYAALWLAAAMGIEQTKLADERLFLMLVGGVGAVVGHSFTFWLRFKGGKGVATAAGAFIAIAPLATGICILIFAAVVAATRYVSLGSVIAAACLVPCVAYFQHDNVLTVVTGCAALMIIIRHRSNISRLFNGTERKIGDKAEQKIK